MKTITIREYGETVYFLNREGFQKGSIKSVMVESNSTTPFRVTYRVTCPKYNKEYYGDEKAGKELFDSHKEMISFYSNQK